MLDLGSSDTALLLEDEVTEDVAAKVVVQALDAPFMSTVVDPPRSISVVFATEFVVGVVVNFDSEVIGGEVEKLVFATVDTAFTVEEKLASVFSCAGGVVPVSSKITHLLL